MPDLILVPFAEHDVLAGKVEPYLQNFHQLVEDRERTLSHAHRLVFFAKGFDDDPRELFQIPEVRSFVQSFDEAVPFWLLFAHLEDMSVLAWMIACLCAEEESIHDGDQVVSSFNHEMFNRWITRQIREIEILLQKHGISQEERSGILTKIVETLNAGLFARVH